SFLLLPFLFLSLPFTLRSRPFKKPSYPLLQLLSRNVAWMDNKQRICTISRRRGTIMNRHQDLIPLHQTTNNLSDNLFLYRNILLIINNLLSLLCQVPFHKGLKPNTTFLMLKH